MGIAEEGQAILGDYFLGLGAGNEPDLFVVPPVSRTRSHMAAERSPLPDLSTHRLRQRVL